MTHTIFINGKPNNYVKKVIIYPKRRYYKYHYMKVYDAYGNEIRDLCRSFTRYKQKILEIIQIYTQKVPDYYLRLG